MVFFTSFFIVSFTKSWDFSRLFFFTFSIFEVKSLDRGEGDGYNYRKLTDCSVKTGWEKWREKNDSKQSFYSNSNHGFSTAVF